MNVLFFEHFIVFGATEGAQVVTNLVLFFSLVIINEIPFSRSIINRFWSTLFQVMDNAVLHYITKKNL